MIAAGSFSGLSQQSDVGGVSRFSCITWATTAQGGAVAVRPKAAAEAIVTLLEFRVGQQQRRRRGGETEPENGQVMLSRIADDRISLRTPPPAFQIKSHSMVDFAAVAMAGQPC